MYQLSYNIAIEIFNITKSFPKEELFSLTDQLRRSSRSIPANIAEAWMKRKYPKSFVSKLIEASAEESETEVWLDFSKDLKYIDNEKYNSFIEKYDEVARMLSPMINIPDKFCH